LAGNPNWKPGVSGNPKGKRKGEVTLVHRDIREMVLAGLNKAGGVDYLAAQAKENPVAFLGLVGKVLPLQNPTNGREGPVLIITGVRRRHRDGPEPVEGELLELPALRLNGNGHDDDGQD
jgi:hypothetical protein